MENYSSPFLPSSHLLPFSSDVNISQIPGDFDMNSNGFQGLNVDISVPNSNGHEESQNGTFDVSQNEKRLRKKGEKKVRQPRYAFQTRSHVDILDDGYRWRKYGQKAVKNNIHPRSYYRCTYQGCGVKKQIQRLSKDDSIVVTTYEGMHSHPIEKSTDNFERILTRMHMYSSY